MYCLSCKKHTTDKNIKPKITKNNKPCFSKMWYLWKK